jgi:hypothetical protein
VQRARADQGLRELTDGAVAGLPRGWAQAVRTAAGGREALLLDRLDTAIAGADLSVRRGTWWWGLFTVLQWLLIVSVLAGVAWLFANPLLAATGLPQLPAVLWYGVPAGTWLLFGGLLGGVLLGILGRALVEIGANAHARIARRNLDEAVSAVVAEEVFEPVLAELDRFRRARDRAAVAASA